jgi:outer membrane biosynthesis protein TonB
MNQSSPCNRFQRALALVLAMFLCGAPELIAQTAQSSQQSSSSNSQQTVPPPTPAPQTGAQPKSPGSQTLDVDPSKGPLQPVTSSTPEPQSTTPPAAPAPSQQQPQQTQSQQSAPAAPAPQGVAAAGEAKTNGGPASEPAGTAIAPAKQHQRRSLLIKVGAIGAGAAALGAIYGLTRSTPGRPSTATTTGTGH